MRRKVNQSALRAVLSTKLLSSFGTVARWMKLEMSKATQKRRAGA